MSAAEIMAAGTERRFIIPGKPRPWKRATPTRWGMRDFANDKRKNTVRAHYMAAKAGKGWHLLPYPVPLTVQLECVFALPKKPRKGSPWRPHGVKMRGQPAVVHVDLDRLMNLIGDALKGLAWDDDDQITHWGNPRKRHVNKGEDPHTVVVIRIDDRADPELWRQTT